MVESHKHSLLQYTSTSTCITLGYIRVITYYVFTLRLHAQQGIKQLVLSVCLSVSTKITRSRDLGICICKHKSVEIFEKLHYASNCLVRTTSVANMAMPINCTLMRMTEHSR